METCTHTDWIRLWRHADKNGIEITDRPHRLMAALRIPEEERPCFMVLIGNDSKQIALDNLDCGGNRSARKLGHGEVHLHLSSLRISTESPVIVANCDFPMHKRLPRSRKRHLCHESSSHALPESFHDTRASEGSDIVLRRALMPFADTICLFVDDIGGLERALGRVAAWADGGPVSSSLARPLLLLVAKHNQRIQTQKCIDEFECAYPGLKLVFQEIAVVPMVSGLISATDRLRFRTQIKAALEAAHAHRSRVNCLFSAVHFCKFLQIAAENVAKESILPFNFVRASRRQRPVSSDLAVHVATLLKTFHSTASVKSVAIPIIASSFVLDQYPPDAHEFCPESVFHALYKNPCVKVYEELNAGRTKILPENFEILLQQEMVKCFDRFRELGASKNVHLERLACLRHKLLSIRLFTTCLFCLSRRPQTRLSCGHSICHICHKIFGDRDNLDEELVHMRSCPVCGCQLQDAAIREPPSTARIRVLSFDGGGMRGIGIIECLTALQNRIGIPYPVIRHFDLCFATSCGVGILMNLCDGIDIHDCKPHFRQSAYRAFQPRRILQSLEKFGLSGLYKFALLLTLICTDSKYPSSNLDRLLKEEYGESRGLIDYSAANEAGISFGFTLTRSGSTDTVIATNYNGAGASRTSPDYDLLEWKDTATWELVRSAIAAPFYFTPHRIGRLGTFQDGGLTFNNPALIAESEAVCLFPRGEPSIVVSIGTGYSQRDESEGPSGLGSFVRRLFGALYKLMDSEAAWERLQIQAKGSQANRRFRLNFTFPSWPPTLDDVKELDQVASVAYSSFCDSVAVEQLATSLRAQLFYFELDETCVPQYIDGSYLCQGYILCRLQVGTRAFETFMKQLNGKSALFRFSRDIIPIKISTQSQRFRQMVRFRVTERSEPFTIVLDENDAKERHICGSPFTIDWLVQQQQLDEVFGTPDHRKKRGRETEFTLARKKRRVTC